MHIPMVYRPTGRNATLTLAEPRPLRRFRRLADLNPGVFRQGKTVVVTDPKLAREVLAFKPDIFPETALLGPQTAQLKTERDAIREYTNHLAKTPLGLSGRIEEQLRQEANTLRALVTAALDTFGTPLLGAYYPSVRASAIRFSLSRINHHYYRNPRRVRDAHRKDLQARIGKLDLATLDQRVFARRIATELHEERPARATRLIADILTGFSIPAVVASCWMFFERSPTGLLHDVGKLESASRQNIAMELLRLRPPAWNHGRPVLETGSIGGQHVAPGDEILIPVGYIHTTSRHWTNPLEFHADRWENQSFGTPAYMPFSLGRRSCVAAQLAMSILEQVVDISLRVDKIDLARNSRYRVGPLYAPPNFRTRLK